MTSIGSGKVSAVRFQESVGIREGIEETQDPLSQVFMSTQEAPDGIGTGVSGTRGIGITYSEGREALCKQLTGLSVRQASISIGKYLNIYWHSLLEIDPLLRAALLPIKNCTPDRLKQCMAALIQRYPDPRGMHRWVNLLMRQLVPVLDWKIVLAYARFNDPAIAEEAIRS
ncbi:MAG: hypothetical protein IH984_07680 [Planctomycetes bacterium]|nr:hypothetical protein [Planctomycetota bacterium]